MPRLLTLCCCAILTAACSDKAPEPWNTREMNELSEQFSHIAQAYAVVDVCIPMIDADKDAKRRVLSKIEVRQYSKLSQMNTEAELAKFLAHHRQTGGTDEQAATLDRIYRDSHRAASQLLTSLDGCVETVIDYVNTILNTRVSATP